MGRVVGVEVGSLTTRGKNLRPKLSLPNSSSRRNLILQCKNRFSKQ
jgi:hypothetical protein